MKTFKKLILLTAIFISTIAFSQIKTTTAVGYKGITTAQRLSVTVPSGQFWRVYDKTIGSWFYWDGSVWVVDNSLTDAEIKTAYENNANTNEFDDAEQTKLGTVETNAKDDQTASEVPIITGVGTPTVNEVQSYLNNTGSSGFFLGGEITDGGAGTVDVAAGSGFIRTTNDSNAELQSFKWSASSTIAVTDNTTQYIYVDDIGAISLSTDEFLETPDKIQLGVVTDEAGVIISTFNLGVRLNEGIGQAGRFIRRVHGVTRDKRKGGIIIGQSGDVNRDVSITAGTLWWGRTEYPFSSFNTSGADTFETYSSSGQENATASQFPNTQYDNAGTLTNLANNRWASLFFYIIPNNGVIMVYGRAEHLNQASAEMEGVPSSSLPSKITETGILVGKIIFQEADNIGILSSAFDQLFANAGVTDHGDLAGLADDDHPQYLLADGTRDLTGNLSVDALVTIDGIDIGVAVPLNTAKISLEDGSVTKVKLATELKTKVALGNVVGVVNIDASLGIHYTMNMTGNVTNLTFTNLTNEELKTITLEITSDGGSYTFFQPTSIKGDWTSFDSTLTNQIQIYMNNVTLPLFTSGFIQW